MGLLYRAGDGAGGAVAGAERAALAFVSNDAVGEQILANSCGAFLVNNMSNILVSEVLKR